MGADLLLVVFAVFFVTLALGIPISISIGIAALSASFLVPMLPASPEFIFRNMVIVIDSTPFLAIPLFIFSGNIMASGGISKKLFDLFAYFFGDKTGGMPIAVIVTTFFYSAFTGSAPATVAAMGAMAIPLLVSYGYDKNFVVAMVTVAGSLGIILPPSVPLVVYGITAGASIGDLFVAGIIPGVLVGLILMVYVFLYFKIRGGEDREKLMENFNNLREKGLLQLFRDSIFALLAPVIILGGIFGGIVTPTEAANISVVYALLISVFLYKTLKITDIPAIMKKSASTTALIFVIISTASVFARVLTLMQAPQQISATLMGMFQSEVAIILVILVVLIIFGLFMEPLSAVLIFTPIFLPIVTAIGINPIHFGAIMILNLSLGFVTPPVGMSLFVASSISGVPVLKIAKHTTPFLILLVIVLLLVTFIPAISLALL
ncbi:MAG: TRAP transporter large permease [Defluviitaleaceae bacterium]|nr:TRAP transporter large permease [Defluviitaleaceae bacterium]